MPTCGNGGLTMPSLTAPIVDDESDQLGLRANFFNLTELDGDDRRVVMTTGVQLPRCGRLRMSLTYSPGASAASAASAMTPR